MASSMMMAMTRRVTDRKARAVVMDPNPWVGLYLLRSCDVRRKNGGKQSQRFCY